MDTFWPNCTTQEVLDTVCGSFVELTLAECKLHSLCRGYESIMLVHGFLRLITTIIILKALVVIGKRARKKLKISNELHKKPSTGGIARMVNAKKIFFLILLECIAPGILSFWLWDGGFGQEPGSIESNLAIVCASLNAIGCCALVAIGIIQGRKVEALTKTLEGTQIRSTPVDRTKQARDVVASVLVVHIVGIALICFVIVGPVPTMFHAYETISIAWCAVLLVPQIFVVRTNVALVLQLRADKSTSEKAKSMQRKMKKKFKARATFAVGVMICGCIMLYFATSGILRSLQGCTAFIIVLDIFGNGSSIGLSSMELIRKTSNRVTPNGGNTSTRRASGMMRTGSIQSSRIGSSTASAPLELNLVTSFRKESVISH